MHELPGLTTKEDLSGATLPSKWYRKEPTVNATATAGKKTVKATATAVKMKGTRKYNCSLCHVTGRKETVLAHIEKEHEQNPPQKCDGCGYKTYSAKCMAEHTKHCTKDANGTGYECDKCNYKTWKCWNLRRHLQSHTQEKAYQCQICHQKYKLKQGLRRHEKKVHSQDDK